MKCLVRPAFYHDITHEELWLLEHAGPEIADRWHESLWATLEFLKSNPLIGRARVDLHYNGIRSWRSELIKLSAGGAAIQGSSTASSARSRLASRPRSCNTRRAPLTSIPATPAKSPGTRQRNIA